MSDPQPNLDAWLEVRLRALAGVLPHDTTLADRVLARLAADAVRPQSNRSVHLRRWIMRSSLGLAAALGLAAGAWSLLGTPRPAFAVLDVTARLRSLHSLHLKGEFTGSKNFGGPHSLEIFLREPDCMRVDGMTLNNNGRVTTLDMAYAPDGFTVVNHADQSVNRVTVPPADRHPEQLHLQVTSQLQTYLQMMFGPARPSADFHRVRAEEIAGVGTDVYQCPTGDQGTVTVWFNPVTQLPVRTEFGPVRFDTIEANPVIPDAVFHPPVPPGYTMVQPKLVPLTDPDAEAESGDNCSFDGMHLNVRCLLDLPDGDVLACWCLYDSAARDQDLKLPDAKAQLTIRSQRGTTYVEHLLHADARPGGWHWRWSLLRPATPPPAGPFVMLSFKAQKPGSSNSGEVTEIPLVFRPDDLPHQIDTLQRQTLPPGSTPMTLEQIEAAASTN